MREPVTPSYLDGIAPFCESSSYTLQAPSANKAVRRHMERALKTADEMERTQRYDLSKDGDAETTIRKVLLDEGYHSVESSSPQLPIALDRKPPSEASREDMPIEMPNELI